MLRAARGKIMKLKIPNFRVVCEMENGEFTIEMHLKRKTKTFSLGDLDHEDLDALFLELAEEECQEGQGDSRSVN